MFLKKSITRYIRNYSDKIKYLKYKMETADAILIGAGAGLSTSAGLNYDGERFQKYFSDFYKKYGITDMYSGGFYPYSTLEEYWAWWSRHIYINRYEPSACKLYEDLLQILKNKNYFVLTTNVDHQFQKAGFDKKKLFYTQGDYGLFQCSRACHNETYDNEEIILRMMSEQQNMQIPTKLIPKCPVCGEPMTVNLRCDDRFVQDKGWYTASNYYENFIKQYKDSNILFLELGVGENTPGIIKYPFWQMTIKNPNAVYVCINLGETVCPKEIEEQAVCINKDIGEVLNDLK